MMNKIDFIWQLRADTSLRHIDQTTKTKNALLSTPYEQHQPDEHQGDIGGLFRI
jgi:hypothetical protein